MQVMNSIILNGRNISRVTLVILAVLNLLFLRERVLQCAPCGMFDEDVALGDQPAATEGAFAVLPVIENATTQHALSKALKRTALHPKGNELQRIYIARHGLRLNWMTSNWTTPTLLPRDPPLAGFGLTQADELAAYFEAMLPEERPTAIFSSPFYRCIQTSTPVAKTLGIPLYLEHGVSEWFSPVISNTGMSPRPTNATALKAIVPIVDDSWSSTWQVSRNGEGLEEFYARVSDFLSAFVPRLESTMESHERILIVGHAASVIAMVHSLVGVRMPIRVGCATVSVLDRTGEDVLGSWTPAGDLASGEFLSGGVQRDWGMEDVEFQDGEVPAEPGEPVKEGDRDTAVGLQWQPSMSNI